MRARVSRATLAGLLLIAGAAAAGAQAGEAAAPRNRLEALALHVRPSSEALGDVYGTHQGFALRYARRFGAHFGLAIEAGERSADGRTPVTQAAASYEASHAALSLRWHPRPATHGADFWLTAGLQQQSVDETVRFPDITVEADGSGSGPLVGLGAAWVGGSGWTLGSELRYGAASMSVDGGGDADLDAVELLAGFGWSF